MTLRVLNRRDALHMANPVDAIQFGLFAALVGYERELERLAERVEELEAAVEDESLQQSASQGRPPQE